jgi:hypothetical protein
MTTIISISLVAAVGALFKIMEIEMENERKAKEAEGWIRC